jgi:hypothetical protein
MDPGPAAQTPEAKRRKIKRHAGQMPDATQLQRTTRYSCDTPAIQLGYILEYTGLLDILYGSLSGFNPILDLGDTNIPPPKNHLDFQLVGGR